MHKLTHLLLIGLLLALPLLSSCPNEVDATQATHAVTAETDAHAGHDHAEESAESHAGHDHAAAEELGTHAEDEAADEHAGHDHAEDSAAEESDHSEGSEEEVAAITLSGEQIRELGIASAPAGPGTLGRELELTGEVAINEDQVTHVSPRIGGIVRKVYHNLGDHIKVGTPLLELDSIELAEMASEHLMLLSRIELAKQTLTREEQLLAKGISAEQDYLTAKQACEEGLIAKRASEQKLAAMGLSAEQITNLATQSDASLTAYTVRAPVTGEIIEKHANLGEMVSPDSELFTIGDLSSVWVRLNVYQQDFLDISEGMEVLIVAGHGVAPVSSVIDYIEPLIGEETRTAVARVVLPTSSHVFRPGLFVTAYVEVGGEQVELVVVRSAVVELDQDKLVFVRTGTSFEPRLISIGRQTATSTEVLSGLEPGEEVVVAGAFQLKAELLKGTFDPHAGHAH